MILKRSESVCYSFHLGVRNFSDLLVWNWGGGQMCPYIRSATNAQFNYGVTSLTINRLVVQSYKV